MKLDLQIHGAESSALNEWPGDLDAWSGTSSALSSTEEIVWIAGRGEMFILVDDPDRENEGDLVILADHATPASINFMVKHGRGLVCLALNQHCADRIGLEPAPRRNVDAFHTPFAHSIDARVGTTTGISAADRARTIRAAVDPDSDESSFVSPGHIFPLIASPGGVLVRPGHTEASVDIAGLANASPAAVICEILNDDGTMARLPDLIRFSDLHGLAIGTISDLVAYRKNLISHCANHTSGAFNYESQLTNF